MVNLQQTVQADSLRKMGYSIPEVAGAGQVNGVISGYWDPEGTSLPLGIRVLFGENLVGEGEEVRGEGGKEPGAWGEKPPARRREKKWTQRLVLRIGLRFPTKPTGGRRVSDRILHHDPKK
jgi:hypothetical protein